MGVHEYNGDKTGMFSDIPLSINDDGKRKYQSITIGIDEHFINSKMSKDYKKYNGLWSLDVSNVHGYGGSKDEALDEFIEKFDVIFEELSRFHKTLHEGRDTLNFTEVDYAGNPID